MKTTQIVFGLILVLLASLMLKTSFVLSESTAMPIFSLYTVLLLLMLLFVYQMKDVMTKMQNTIDGLGTELIRIREVLEAERGDADSTQHLADPEPGYMQWDSLDQSEKDEHIAKIQKSMEYTGDESNSEQAMDNRQPLFH